MSLFMVDVEADGPCPGKYSMVSFAAVRVQAEPLSCHFYGKTAPLTEHFDEEALAACNTTRQQHLTYEDPTAVMRRFAKWLEQTSTGAPMLISDNPAFDWQFINYYFHVLLGDNPFGHSARRIGDLFSGLERNFYAQSRWKRLCKTRHTHHPVDDAKGNVEALLSFSQKHGFKLPLK